MLAYSSAPPLLQIDLLPSEEAVKAVEAAIQQHNSAVSILHTTRCTMDIAQILNQGAFMGSSHPPSLQAVREVLNADGADQNHAQGSHATQHAKPDIDVSLLSSGGTGNEGAARPRTHDGTTVQNQHSHSGHGHHNHQHDSSVRSVSITQPGQVDMPR